MHYSTTQAHLLDELERIEDVLAAALEAEGVEAEEQAEAPSDPAVDAAEAAERPAELEFAVPDDARERAAEAAAEIRERVEETPADVDLRLHHVAERFDLSRRHLDALLLALAPAVDDSHGRTLERLQSEHGLRYPTVGLIEDLFGPTEGHRLAASALVGPESPLTDANLLEVHETMGTANSVRKRPVSVDSRVVSYLKGLPGLDPLLTDVAEIETPATDLADLRLDGDTRERLEGLSVDGSPRIHHFHGPDGAGRERAVDALVDGRVLRADLGDVLASGLLGRLRREADLLDCPLHLTNVADATDDGTDVEPEDEGALPEPDPPSIDEVCARLSDVETDVYLTGTEPWTPDGTLDREYAVVAFPVPDHGLRRRCWTDHEDRLPAGLDPETLASTFRLTQGQIDAAMETAGAIADGAGGGFLPREAVLDGCKAQSAAGLDELAQHIEPSADWDDIVLPEDTEDELREVAARVRHRGTVYEEWGFEERFSRGTGVVAMFAGPSGTGKTMAVEIVAADAGMDVYKIDLSSVVSKYIGETEENLERIFDAARDANAVLLFDEADAVFGQRAAVSDATDRYANVEVNYLLQRIESYDGVVILTTNNEGHLDDAFTRRIHQSVTFGRPDSEAREAIWRLMFPADTPTEGIDYEALGRLDLTGGNVRNAAQTAAVLAADDGGTVRMEHVLEAIQREYDKLGKMLDPTDLEEHRELLSD